MRGPAVGACILIAPIDPRLRGCRRQAFVDGPLSHCGTGAAEILRGRLQIESPGGSQDALAGASSASAPARHPAPCDACAGEIRIPLPAFGQPVRASAGAWERSQAPPRPRDSDAGFAARRWLLVHILIPPGGINAGCQPRGRTAPSATHHRASALGASRILGSRPVGEQLRPGHMVGSRGLDMSLLLERTAVPPAPRPLNIPGARK